MSGSLSCICLYASERNWSKGKSCRLARISPTERDEFAEVDWFNALDGVGVPVDSGNATGMEPGETEEPADEQPATLDHKKHKINIHWKIFLDNFQATSYFRVSIWNVKVDSFLSLTHAHREINMPAADRVGKKISRYRTPRGDKRHGLSDGH